MKSDVCGDKLSTLICWFSEVNRELFRARLWPFGIFSQGCDSFWPTCRLFKLTSLGEITWPSETDASCAVAAVLADATGIFENDYDCFSPLVRSVYSTFSKCECDFCVFKIKHGIRFLNITASTPRTCYPNVLVPSHFFFLLSCQTGAYSFIFKPQQTQARRRMRMHTCKCHL